MHLEVWQWAALAISAFSIGLSKAGFSGISLISVFLLAEIFGSKESLGIALPMLIAADLLVFPAFRKYGSWKEVWILLWPTLIGGVLAVYVLGEADDLLMRRIIGGIIFLMVVMQLARKWKPDEVFKLAVTKGFGVFAGLAGGLATVLANAAGPIQQMYLLSKRMEKMELIGVGARFFLIVNLLKLPLNAQFDLMSPATLMINLIALPAVVIGVLGGKKLLSKVPQKLFENLIVVFALVASI